MFSTTLRKEMGSPIVMRHYFRVVDALENLPASFHYNELMEVLISSGLSLSTAKRIRTRLLEMEILVKEEDNYRFSSRQWRGKLKWNFREKGSR